MTENLKIKQVAEKVKQVVEKKLNINNVEIRTEESADIRSYMINSDKIKKILQEVIWILDDVEDVFLTVMDCEKVVVSPLNENMKTILDYCKMFLGGMSIKTANNMRKMYGNDAVYLLGGSLLRYGDQIGKGIIEIKKLLSNRD